MGVLNAIGALFSSDKAVDAVLDKDKGLLVRGGQWIDNLSYTEQEKAQMALELTQVANDRLKALEPFKVVQRILAFGITSMWIFVGINVVAAIWVDEHLGTQVTEPMLEFAFSDYVFWPVVSVLSLYFLGGVVPSGLGRKRNGNKA